VKIEDIISSGLLELYALGMASPEETQQVEEWLSKYPEAVKELDQIQASMESYAQAHAIPPPPELKTKVLQEVGVPASDTSDKPGAAVIPMSSEKAPAASYTIRSYFKWAAVACFILLLGSLALTYVYYNRYTEANSQLALERSRASEMDRQIALERSRASEMDRQISLMTDRYAQPVSLDGTPKAPEASAKVFWMKNTGEVYVAPGSLPTPPPGKQYQLWAMIDGKPVDAGLITTKKGSTYSIQKMKSFGKVEAFAITLEKEGGSPTPDLDNLYVIGKM
jgi:hypothetical protein